MNMIKAACLVFVYIMIIAFTIQETPNPIAREEFPSTCKRYSLIKPVRVLVSEYG